MDLLLKKIIEAPGVSGYESEIAKIMHDEFEKKIGRASCRERVYVLV